MPRAGTAFRFAPVNDVALGLWEGDRPVLAYNHGVLLKKGVPANFARSSYVHPLYGLDGEVITDDFPADHFHHRGLFWGWPHVKVGGKEYDNWACGAWPRSSRRWLAREAGPAGAVLGVQNGWYVGNRRVLDEQVWFRVHPASHGRRAIDVELWLKPLEPVTLSRAEGKSYGGMTLRFAPGDDTQITVPSGRTGDDLYINRQPWTDLTRKWPGRKEPSGSALRGEGPPRLSAHLAHPALRRPLPRLAGRDPEDPAGRSGVAAVVPGLDPQGHARRPPAWQGLCRLPREPSEADPAGVRGDRIGDRGVGPISLDPPCNCQKLVPEDHPTPQSAAGGVSKPAAVRHNGISRPSRS